MDVLNDPDIEPEIKILILLYIFAYVLPEKEEELTSVNKVA